ncbi:hypothetical protein IQ268_04025 [Oculatella sp. LEGE 06141]|nr:hypothetical protein [Oculatella sp. LEGE 06141]MBE9177747.1 hypothetical protein [Oculatella sp. LEGE 06141]
MPESWIGDRICLAPPFANSPLNAISARLGDPQEFSQSGGSAYSGR